MNPYILFIGTSHTAGQCHRGESEFLDENDLWCKLLADKLQLPYKKIGIPGVENWELTQNLLHVIEQDPNFQQNCKFIILVSKTLRTMYFKTGNLMARTTNLA